MGKTQFQKPGNFLYPVPAVMVSCGRTDEKPNIITVAWAGTVCSDPPMVSISVRKSRYSHQLIRESGEFVINLTTEELVRAADLCGVISGRDADKFERCGLHPQKGFAVQAPLIEESPVNIECRVKQVLELGTHDMFLAEVISVEVDESYLDAAGKFRMEDVKLTAYSHGSYYGLGKVLGTFGYSVRKKGKTGKNRKKKNKK